MATFDYAHSQATADRLLKRFGQAATLVRSSTTGGNAWDPGSGTTTSTDYPCTVAVMAYATEDIDGTIIQANDRKVYMSALGLAVSPQPTDVLSIGGQDYAVVNVTPLNPAGTPVYFECQCRA